PQGRTDLVELIHRLLHRRYIDRAALGELVISSKQVMPSLWVVVQDVQSAAIELNGTNMVTSFVKRPADTFDGTRKIGGALAKDLGIGFNTAENADRPVEVMVCLSCIPAAQQCLPGVPKR